MKCKKQVEIQNPNEKPTPRGAIRVFGTCGTCGTKVNTFRSAKEGPKKSIRTKSGGKRRSRSRSSRKSRA